MPTLKNIADILHYDFEKFQQRFLTKKDKIISSNYGKILCGPGISMTKRLYLRIHNGKLSPYLIKNFIKMLIDTCILQPLFAENMF
jgi:hypothetical protein